MSRLVEQFWPDILQEGLNEVLWHITTEWKAVEILESGELKGRWL